MPLDLLGPSLVCIPHPNDYTYKHILSMPHFEVLDEHELGETLFNPQHALLAPLHQSSGGPEKTSAGLFTTCLLGCPRSGWSEDTGARSWDTPSPPPCHPEPPRKLQSKSYWTPSPILGRNILPTSKRKTNVQNISLENKIVPWTASC